MKLKMIVVELINTPIERAREGASSEGTASNSWVAMGAVGLDIATEMGEMAADDTKVRLQKVAMATQGIQNVAPQAVSRLAILSSGPAAVSPRYDW